MAVVVVVVHSDGKSPRPIFGYGGSIPEQTFTNVSEKAMDELVEV